MKQETQEKKGYGIASFVMGIVSIVVPVWFLLAPIVAGILGIVFFVKQKNEQPTGLATAGLVLSIIGLSIWSIVGFFVMFLVWIATLMGGY